MRLHRCAFSAFLTRPCQLGGTSAFCMKLHSRVHRGGLFDTLASRLPHPGDLHKCLHRLPRGVDLLFWGPCHCYFEPRLPVHFIILVCLMVVHGHSAHDDDRLPTPVQRHGGEDASVTEGVFSGTLFFFLLAYGAALGPPRPQERASGAVWLCPTAVTSVICF